MRHFLYAALLGSVLVTGCDSGTGVVVNEGNDATGDATGATPDAQAAGVEPPVIGAATGSPGEVGSWGEVLSWPHVAVSMANLPDGRILTYSGSERRTWPTTERTFSATWDPQTGEFIENLHDGHNMFCAALSMTHDGQVFVNGGRNQGNSPWTTLFNYRDNQWNSAQNMASGGRWYPTTLTMGNGNIMTALGSSRNTRNPDLWDPVDGWRVLNGIDFINMRQRNNERGRDNSFPLLSVAPNGNVYHYWDQVENQMVSASGNGSSRSANPDSDENHAGGVQLTYDVGKLLITGRNDGSWGGNATGAESDAFTVDLNGGVPVIRGTSDMKHKRKYHQLIPLPTGEVLVIGGNTTGAKFRDSGSVMEPEIWNPQTGQWRPMANMAVPRDYHSTALLLTDGRVLTAGGGYSSGDANSSGTHQDAQLFSPPYLFASNGSLAAKPTVTAANAIVDTGGVLPVTTTGSVEYFSMIRMSATTHAMNTDARFYKPAFTQTSDGAYDVVIHQNPNVSIPGYWMLFAVDANGVPSDAQVIRVSALDVRLDNLAVSGSATQSSTLNDTGTFDAGNAIDGDLSGVDESGSLTHTNSEASPWWELDLGRVVDVDTIRVWNRTDCCAERLADMHVLVSKTPIVSKDLSIASSQAGVTDIPVAGIAGRQTDLPVGSQARYIRVQLGGTGILQLAEVQVFGSRRSDVSNLARSGVASQSSNYNNTFIAAAAIDGVTSSNADEQNETVGGNGGAAFDLSCSATEVLVGMHGTTGTYVNSVGPRCVAVDNAGNWVGTPRDGERSGGGGGTAYSQTCPVGQAVTGFTAGSGQYVNRIGLRCQDLTAAQAVSGPITTLADIGTGGATSGPFDCGAIADGVLGRSGSWMDAFGLQCRSTSTGAAFNHTQNDNNAWWELDLGRRVDIDSIMIWNRTDCCTDRISNYYVFVSDEPFSSKALNNTINQQGVMVSRHTETPSATMEIPVGRTGRYVRVQLAGQNFLHMREVQVIGAELNTPLAVTPIVAAPSVVGGDFTFNATAEGSGSLSYQWNFGDGTPDTGFTSSPAVTHNYVAPGRYVVSLTVRDASGDEVRETFTQIVHPALTANNAKSSSSVLVHSNGNQVWSVNPDNATVSVIDESALSLAAELPVGLSPVSVAEAADGRVWVVNAVSATISVINPVSLTVEQTIALPRSSLPYGIVFGGSSAYVALEATAEVIKLSLTGVEQARQSVGANPRHLSIDSEGVTLYVSRFITPVLPGEDTATPVVEDASGKYGGEMLVMATSDLSVTDTVILAHADKPASENEGPGIPNYLGAMALSPDGKTGWLPSKQDNILGGALRGGPGLAFDQTVRAVTSKIDLDNLVEINGDRVDHDNASVAGNAVFDPFGVTLFVSLEGNRQISIIDVSTAIEIGRFDTGRAPQGMAVSADGKRLYVHNFMDRTMGVYDIDAIVQSGEATATELAVIDVVTTESLDATVLRGKQLFYDARDDRLAGLDYMSCASCHENGGHDGRTWDFTGVGEGLRNTITLRGRAGMGHGILHWTGNFDEVQDFEGQIREFAGGSGLMDDALFAGVSDPLGNAKAGLSDDLDAMAAYLTSLERVPDSPWRNADGTLTASAEAGKLVFSAAGCAACHTGEPFTDSATAALHDIGSIMADSGKRLGQDLTGLDTPTLLGVWNTAPYLHDGSATTLQEAITAHINITLTTAELDQLADYLNQADATENGAPPVLPPIVPPPPAPANGVFSNVFANNGVTIDGAVGEWSAADSFGGDANDMNGANTLDWLDAWVAHDDNNYYIAYQVEETATYAWGYGIYIDTDGNPDTGFRGFANEYPIGVDYLIESGAVQKYTGAGNDWSWGSAVQANIALSAGTVETVVPRSELANATTLRLFFRADSGSIGGTGVDFFPDAVTDASASIGDRQFVYSVANANGNTPPVAIAQSVEAPANGSIAIILSGSDADSDALGFEVLDQPVTGTLIGTAPNLSYQAADGFTGVDSFSFAVNDGNATSAPATVSVAVIGDSISTELAVTVNGDLTEWGGVSSLGIDPLDANGPSDSIDWVEAWIAHDSANIYWAYRNESAITPGWGYGIYIDSDGSSATGFTGFLNEYPLGADFLIEGTDLQRYTGSGQNWSWTSVGQVSLQAQGNSAELAVPQTLLGSPETLKFFFLGNNVSVGGDTFDYYPDGAGDTAATFRQFEYTTSPFVNTAPLAQGQALTTGFATAVNIVLSGSDANADTLTFEITQQPQNGTLAGTPPNVTYTPDADFSGADSIAFRVNDGALSSDPAVVTVTVEPQAPIAANGFVSNPVEQITIDGSVGDWQGLEPFATDAADVSAAAQPLKIDWLQARMAHNATDLFLMWQNQGNVGQLRWGHGLMIDADNSAGTGFTEGSALGVDYLLEGTDLYRYSGGGSDWLWSYVTTVETRVVGDVAEVRIPRVQLNNPSAMQLFFRGDNSSLFDDGPTDYYPDAVGNPAAAAADRSFRYEF